MHGILKSSNYTYQNVQLSNVKVDATGVVVKNGKVAQISNANVRMNDSAPASGDIEMMENSSFSFSVSDTNPELRYNLNYAPISVNGRDIILEFIAFVEADIA